VPKPYREEEAIRLALEFFEGDELRASVFLRRYALRDREGRPLEATPEPLRSLEAAPREALKVTFREAQEEVETPRKKRPRLLSMEKNEILKGMVWHEILKPPKGW
jgi:hypothetical protein